MVLSNKSPNLDVSCLWALPVMIRTNKRALADLVFNMEAVRSFKEVAISEFCWNVGIAVGMRHAHRRFRGCGNQ